jgi:hypothetical protein
MTWTLFHSAFSSVYNNVKGSLDSGYITELKPGHLINILFVGRQDGSSKPLLNPETTGLLLMKCLLAQLYDSGASWSQFRELDLLPQTGASPNCEILRLQDGTLLCTLRKLEKWDGHPKGVWLGNNRVLLVYYAGDNN